MIQDDDELTQHVLKLKTFIFHYLIDWVCYAVKISYLNTTYLAVDATPPRQNLCMLGKGNKTYHSCLLDTVFYSTLKEALYVFNEHVHLTSLALIDGEEYGTCGHFSDLYTCGRRYCRITVGLFCICFS